MKKLFAHALLAVMLFVVGALAVLPVLILVSGSITGEAELYGWIAPILGDQEGFVRLRLFPDYPTLRNFVELLLDSPEFFWMFWNTQRISVETLAGGLLFGVPCAWGLAQYRFPGRKAILWCCILLMIMPFQVTMLSEYLVLKQLGLLDTFAAVILPGNLPDTSGVYHVPFLLRRAERAARGGAYRRGGRAWNLLKSRRSGRLIRDFFRHDAAISGMSEHGGAATYFFEK